MAFELRQRSQSIPENNLDSNTQNQSPSIQSSSISKNANNRMSLPPGSSATLNYSTGKTWKKLFGSQNSKQTTNEISNTCLEADLTYITPRLIVMTTPGQEFSDEICRPIFETIHNHLNTKHTDSYMIYSLDRLSSDDLSDKRGFSQNRIVNLPLFDENQSLSLIILLWFCQKVTFYLLESPSNVVILHCVNEKNQLIFGGCSLLAYHKIFSRVDQIIHFYQSKRSTTDCLTKSHRRYIEYLCDLSSDYIEQPHFNQVYLKSLHLTPVPLVNKQRTGCRPFVEIYDQENNKILSTYDEIPKLRVYSAADNICMIPIDLFFNGDLTIHITHATVGHSRQTHEGGIRICELTINSNFSTKNHPNLFYSRNELDGIESTDKNPVLFHLTIETNHELNSIEKKQDSFTDHLMKTLKQPLVLFHNQEQLQLITNYFNDSYYSTSTVVRRQNPTGKPPTRSVTSIINPRNVSYIQQYQQNQDDKRKTLLDLDDDENQTQFNIPHLSQTQSNSNQQQSLLDSFDTDSILSDTSALLTPTQLKATEQQQSSTPTTSTPNYNTPIETDISPLPTASSIPTSTSSNSNEKRKTVDLDIDFQKYFPFQINEKIQFEPKTSISIGAARRAVNEKGMDPTTLKIRQWTEGKERNLRALLCSLSTVTWPDCTWQGCQMNELVTKEQVRKVYKKAVLHIHPDKLCGHPSEQLAKFIFVELNEAWAQFEKDNQ